MTPEFSRPERLDTIGDSDRTVRIAAGAGECEAVAARFGLLAVDRLEAVLAVRREGTGVMVTGRVSGDVVQACSVTGDPVPARVDEPVALRFVVDMDAPEEVELSADLLDTLPIEGGAIDLGEAAAETLALALDPFPRSPNAQAILANAGVIGEDDVRPFGGLAGLRDKLAS